MCAKQLRLASNVGGTFDPRERQHFRAGVDPHRAVTGIDDDEWVHLGSGVDVDRLDVSLQEVPRREGIDYDWAILFSESQSRFVVEVPHARLGELRTILGDVPHGVIGRVTEDERIRIHGRDLTTMVDVSVHDARRAWKEPIFRVFGEEGP